MHNTNYPPRSRGVGEINREFVDCLKLIQEFDGKSGTREWLEAKKKRLAEELYNAIRNAK